MDDSFSDTSTSGESPFTTDSDFDFDEPRYTKDYDLHQIRASTTERFCAEVPLPAQELLSDEEFFLSPGVLNLPKIKSHLTDEGRIKKEHFLWLIDQVYDIFCGEPNVLAVPAPVTVCGDVHGQFYDMIKLLELGGDPANTTYLWLGDYVDRGNFSVEVLILLYSYKVSYPDNFFMIRGNHECRHLTEYFTFKEECLYKFDIEVYQAVMDTFDALPLAAVMNQQFFCVHGGLSPALSSIDDIQVLDRFTEPPSQGLMCDLLWADPMEQFDPDTACDDWEPNQLRKTSWSFGYNPTCAFLDQNKYLSVIRAHEAQEAGYRMYHKNNSTGFPSLITLFSAPNYLSNYNNKGAILRYENNVLNIRQFNDSPSPYYLPKFMNVFAWSLPFVAEKISELLIVFLRLVDDAEADQADEEARVKQEEIEHKREVLRNKVQSVGKMLAVFKKLRQEREAALKSANSTAQSESHGVPDSPTLKRIQFNRNMEEVPPSSSESPPHSSPSSPHRKRTKELKDSLRTTRRTDSKGNLTDSLPLIKFSIKSARAGVKDTEETEQPQPPKHQTQSTPTKPSLPSANKPKPSEAD